MAALPATFRVTQRLQETHDTWTLRLEPVAGDAEPRPAFAPGQFAMLYAFGAGEVPISVSAIPEGDASLVHTVRAVGATTRAICASSPGAVLGLRGPFGTSWPLAAASGHDVVLVAGGIGLAPLRPVVHALLARPERYGRVTVLIGGRSPAELPYAEEIEAWRAHPGVVRRADRRRGAGGLDRPRRRRHTPHPRRTVRSAAHGGDDVRAGGHDALRRRRPARPRCAGPRASGSRWSAA